MIDMISAVICAYNEEENIVQLTKALLEVLDKINKRFEIIYVIEGTDKTKEFVEGFNNKNIKIIYNEKPSGLGNAFRLGFNAISDDSDIVVTMDADLNHDPAEIPKLLARLVENNAKIVIGSRALFDSEIVGLAKWRRAVSQFTNHFLKLFIKFPVMDKTSGYRLYSADHLRNIRNLYKSDNFAFLFELLLLSRQEKMIESPITFTFRTKGKSKFNFFSAGRGYFALMVKMLKEKRYIVTKFVAHIRFLKSQKYLDKGDKILDAGCGNCKILRKISNRGYNIIGIDKKYPANIIYNIEKETPFDMNTFDKIICFEVIEHCDCIEELIRILKHNGLLIISTPTPNTDFIRTILVKLRLLEAQDFEHHDHLINLKTITKKYPNLRRISMKKMFCGTSQFGVFCKVNNDE